MTSGVHVCEIRELSKSRFAESVHEADLRTSHDYSDAKLTVPWENGIWQFSGREKPLAGTLVIVEENSAGQSIIVGTCTSFYDLSFNETSK